MKLNWVSYDYCNIFRNDNRLCFYVYQKFINKLFNFKIFYEVKVLGFRSYFLEKRKK